MTTDIKDYLHLEQWRVIQHFPKYEVSNISRVRSRITGRIIKQRLRRDGYLDVRIENVLGDWRTIKVHRLVAREWVEWTYIEQCVVNHKDFNKQNNLADNLEWLTVKENIHHAINGGHRNDFGGNRFPVTEAQELAKKKVVLNDVRVFNSITELAIYLGVKQSTISQSLKRGNKVLKTNTVRYGN